jgi:hypothetical protein
MKKTVFMLIVIMMFALDFAQIGTHIPESRLPFDEQGVLEWTKAGCLEDIRNNGGMVIDKFIDVTQDLDDPEIFGDSFTEKIISLVNSSVADDPYSNQALLIYFPPGEYEFDETIEINRDNVIFRGAGADKTTLLFTKEWGEDLDEQLLRYNLFEVEGSSYIGFENMKLETVDSTTINSSNNLSDYDGMYVKFINSNYCWVAGVEMFKAQRHHIVINKSSHIEIRGCYFSKAHSYGGGGNGYGVQLLDSLTTYCLIEDNI